MKKAQKGVGGSGSCAAVEELRQLDTRIGDLKTAAGDPDGKLASAASRAGRSGDDGAYDCGVQEYKSGDFSNAQQTMDKFVAGHPHHKNRARAQKIAIAAEVAQTIPAVNEAAHHRQRRQHLRHGEERQPGRRDRPLHRSGHRQLHPEGLRRLPVVPARRHADVHLQALRRWQDYPQRTLQLPVGTTYFVHKPNGGQVTTAGSDTAKLRPGYIYTECAYTTQGFGGSGT